MKNVMIAAFLIIALLLLAGCSSVTIEEINDDPEKYVGKKVVVSGTVAAPLKFGLISGFSLVDDGAMVLVASDDVPDALEEVKVKGTVVQGLLMPHYIYADKVIKR